MIKEHTYYIKGMHCASCEVLIEKKLLEIQGIKSVEASLAKNRATVEYEGEKPNIEKLNDVFKKDSYLFFNNEYEAEKANSIKTKTSNTIRKTLAAFNIAMLIVVAFLILQKAGVDNFLNVTSSSSLLTFFGFGVLAGLSTCAALVGGIVLSMSKQWKELYFKENSTYQKFQPHLLFNTGRVLSYGLFGGFLGLLGSRLQLSLNITSFLVIAISLLMVAFGLQMLQVKGFRGFQITMPKFITRKIAKENNFNGKHMPFLMGAATFFLPCGFTVTAQSLALLSGSYVQGFLIMGAFALGTVPTLLLIGLSSVKFLERPHLSEMFSKVAGFLIIFFALFNIGSQMGVLGITIDKVLANDAQELSLNNIGLAPIVDGKQILEMTVYGLKYSPNYFKVKAGIPVKWEITSSGQPGCAAGAVVARGLVKSDIVYLNPNQGEAKVVEFTPEKPGKYAFSCTMNMVRGIIEVIK